MEVRSFFAWNQTYTNVWVHKRGIRTCPMTGSRKEKRYLAKYRMRARRRKCRKEGHRKQEEKAVLSPKDTKKHGKGDFLQRGTNFENVFNVRHLVSKRYLVWG